VGTDTGLQLLRITFTLWLICLPSTSPLLNSRDGPTNPRVFDEPKHESATGERRKLDHLRESTLRVTTFIVVYSLDLMLPFVELQQDKTGPMMSGRAGDKSIWVTTSVGNQRRSEGER